MRKHFFKLGTAAAMVIALSACGSKAPRPSSELALTSSALKNAELAGAREHAPLEFRAARQRQIEADEAMKAGKFSKARYLTVEARADAELARAAADAQKARLELKRTQDNLQGLRRELVPVSKSQ